MSVRLFACSIRLLARLYFSLFCALNTGALHLKLRSFISIRSVSADTVVFINSFFVNEMFDEIIMFYITYLLPFYLCLYLFLRLFLRTGSASLPLRYVCDNDQAKGRGGLMPRPS